MKKILIVANWKMNPQNLAEAKQIFNAVAKGIKNIRNVEVVICPPFVYLPCILNTIYCIRAAAQNCFYEERGAFTGEISPIMLKNMGCEYVILGHSERRKYQKETDEIINKKIKSALKAELKPILCVDKIPQVKNCLKDVSKEEIKNIIIAYEPLFAIGTGNSCGLNKAGETRNLIKKEFGENIPILYGGSVNSQNAEDYIKTAGFSGLLVGGASLKAEEFVKIANSLIFP